MLFPEVSPRRGPPESLYSPFLRVNLSGGYPAPAPERMLSFVLLNHFMDRR